MKADLHMHSTHSDGLLTTKELFDRAKKNGVDLIAITDHDIVKGVSENMEYANELGIKYIPGVELSTVMDGKPVHVLGYFTDDSYNNPELQKYFKEIKIKREERAKKFVANLKTYFDIEITYEMVLGFSRGIIARPHIAKAISTVYPQYQHNYIFDHFIGDNSIAYVPSCDLGVTEGIKMLKDSNCLVVLAHPTLLKETIKSTILSLDFDGIEEGMFITGGGDFHGIINDTKHADIGDIFIDGLDYDKFIERFNSKKENIL
jgi:predicted metal-dependent phosphoesterase TrpH